jgi:hypothetical protein
MKHHQKLDLSELESGIRIDREGLWSYKGNDIPRRDIVRLFYQNLRQDESGLYFIEIGSQRCSVEVEDTAFTVWAVHRNQSDESIHLLLSDDSVEELDPGTLRIGHDNVPYCRVKNSGFDARFSRSSYYQLAEHIKYDPPRNAHYLTMRGQTHYIARL